MPDGECVTAVGSTARPARHISRSWYHPSRLLPPGACLPWCIAPIALHPARKVVYVATRPRADPVASFPPSTDCGAVASATKVTLSTGCALPRWEVSDDRAALEAAAAAGEVVVAAAAVPVTWADVQGGQHTNRAIAVAELQVRAWITATLAVVTAAEVEMLAVLAVPVSRLPLVVHSQ